jgi:transcriptional regulator with XRE-family HTH domain
MKISERLKQLRTLHGLKLREVSKKTGLSLSYISDLERGRQNPSLETCQKLATVYKITLSEMFVEVKL